MDGRGNAYINGTGFDARAGDPFAPGIIAMVTPQGVARQVADDIHFPNGMAITPDNSTLVIAESFARRLSAFDIDADGSLSNRRVWADLGDGAPDGICFDAEGAIWYADVPNKRCVRVREGGDVLQTVDVDRGCFACMLGGDDGATLFITAAIWRGFEHMTRWIARRRAALGARTCTARRPPVNATLARWNVVVHPEEVRRIVLRLQLREPFVVRTVRRADSRARIVGVEVVDVHAAAERLYGVPELARPCDVAVGRSGIGPLRDDVEIPARFAQAERGR